MEWFTDFITSNAYLAHLAALCYAIGLLIRDQLTLRLLILGGTGFYIAYYYLAPAVPLWDAIIWSVILGLCNLSVILRVIHERTLFTMSHEDRALFDRFEKLNPGEFRRLMKIGHWREGDGSTHLTTEGEVNNRLFFVLSGDVRVEKKGKAFSIDQGGFLGEVGYLLNRPASATTIVASGGRYIEWPRGHLARLEQANPGIRIALRDIINMDMAEKVAEADGPEHKQFLDIRLAATAS